MGSRIVSHVMGVELASASPLADEVKLGAEPGARCTVILWLIGMGCSRNPCPRGAGWPCRQVFATCVDRRSGLCPTGGLRPGASCIFRHIRQILTDPDVIGDVGSNCRGTPSVAGRDHPALDPPEA